MLRTHFKMWKYFINIASIYAFIRDINYKNNYIIVKYICWNSGKQWRKENDCAYLKKLMYIINVIKLIIHVPIFKL